MKILVTGASGFVGSALCNALAREGLVVRAALRDDSRGSALPAPVARVAVGAVGPATDWSAALSGIDVVVHLAARAHAFDAHGSDAAAECDRVNHLATATLGRQAATAGVRRLVFASSIKVNGEVTGERPFCESDPPAPGDAYAVAKWNAEQVLTGLANALEVVILRPPLIYGPGVKGNLLRLMHAIARGVPLPLASIDNRRSLLGLDNLVAAITLCIRHPAAAGQTYLVSDGEGVSTPLLIRLIAEAMGRPARLLPCPVSLLRLAGKLTGNDAAVMRLVGSLQGDASRIRRELGWQPATPLAAGLARMARWYDQQFNHDPPT